MKWHADLTEKQRKFVEAYLGEAKGNATEAARLAGYSGSNTTLRSVGKENITKPHILEAIEACREELLATGNYPMVTPDRIHREWLDLLEDPETTRTQKIRLLSDAARANAMFTHTVDVNYMGRPKRLVMEKWDEENEDPMEYIERALKN